MDLFGVSFGVMVCYLGYCTYQREDPGSWDRRLSIVQMILGGLMAFVFMLPN